MEHKVLHGNNIDLLKSYPDNYFDAIVTDPPYGLGEEPNAVELMKDWVDKGYHEISGKGFMGKEWDAFVPQPLFWKEAYRVLKHGGHVLSFFGTRTYDWGVMAMRFAGFEVRDCIQWHYGSGFPKSHNIGKAIDKMKGAERTDVIGKRSRNVKPYDDSNGWNNNNTKGDFEYTAPATEEAKKWEGWGSALKPATEPIVLARKPLEKGLSIAENVLKWGTGGINIDGCRVATKEDLSKNYNSIRKSDDVMGERGYKMGFRQGRDSYAEATESTSLGRFPANIILTHSNYQVMNLVGNIDSHKLAEIIRYFYGYTKVSDLRERKGSSSKQNKCRDEVLQSRVQKDFSKEEPNSKQSSSELSELSNSIHSDDGALSERQKEVLLPPMQRPTSETNEGEKSNQIRNEAYGGVQEKNGRNEDKERNNIIEGKASELERREDEPSRICEHNDFNTTDGLARNGENNATQTNIYFGTQNNNGDAIKKTSIGFGECSSHQRYKERQQTEQFSDRGQSESLQSTSEDGCRDGSITQGKPILEVLDIDVPAEWLRYFEYTGENLGCECKGLKKVKGSSGQLTDGEGEERETKFGQIKSNKVTTYYGSEETVEAWECHENCPIRIIDEQGISMGMHSAGVERKKDVKSEYDNSSFHAPKTRQMNRFGDSGGASRFFYCAKASKSERNNGLNEQLGKRKTPMAGRGQGGLKCKKCNKWKNSGNPCKCQNPEFEEIKFESKPNFNGHPTVKPVKLMQYLVRLITPPNGKVLDPFCGSGTTGIASKLEGFSFVGMEQDAEYSKIAQARIDNYQEEPEEKLQFIEEGENDDKPKQLGLF